MIAPSPAFDRVAPNWGSSLAPEDYSALSRSWITAEIADRGMLRRVGDQEGREVVAHRGKSDLSGILFPYYWPGEPHPVAYRLRRDRPEVVHGSKGEKKLKNKYLSAPGDRNRLYIPPGVTAEDLSDVTMPIVITEGEKKCLALSRLAHHESVPARFIAIAISGVWNWQGRVGKTPGPNGERLDERGPIPDLDRIQWDGRKALIIFDSNVHHNEDVQRARRALARELTVRKAAVYFVELPADCGVNGVDDLLGAWGPDRVLALFDEPVPATAPSAQMSPQFASDSSGMSRVTTKGELLTRVQLANYRAEITANILLDDGMDASREFEIAAELDERKHRFKVSASEFARMDWPIEQMGATAITFPSQKDYARTAIQWLSKSVVDRRIYTHSGWRIVDGRAIFLHADGAIGGAGRIPEINIQFPGAMASYRLDLPAGQDELIAALRASLHLADLGPRSVTFPLLAATWRAVLGEADFALHLAGETGVFKSEAAALFQQHFGAGMDRRHLPGTWSSTGNALEAMVFHAKDTLFVIDDFAPQGAANEVARYHAAADRVFRAAGNHAGRGRLDSKVRLRESKPPRGLILSTGEEIPRGHSIRARLLILELTKGAIDPIRLTDCQQRGRDGVYARAMGAFVQWVAGRYDDVQALFKAKLAAMRVHAVKSAAHARTPEIVANLQAGFDLYLDFCVASGAVGEAEQEPLAACCWEALQEAAAAQTKHQAATEPTAAYLSHLSALLTSGRAHFEGRSGGAPAGRERACGWRVDCSGSWSALGNCIGWVDGDHIYLQPTAAYRLVQTAGRDGGEILPVSEQTLRRRMADKGLLASRDLARGTLTIRKRIGGAGRDVLDLFWNTVFPDALDDEDEFVG